MKGEEAYQAIILGLGTIQYLAARLEQSRVVFTMLDHNLEQRKESQDIRQTPQTIIADNTKMLHRTAVKVREIMNEVADFLNNCDAVDKDDEKATEHAFRFMRRIIDGKTEEDETEDDDLEQLVEEN